MGGMCLCWPHAAAPDVSAFTALRDLGVPATVTGWLMCTDNMPSGTAVKLGDVLTARNGTTAEINGVTAITDTQLTVLIPITVAAADYIHAVRQAEVLIL